MAEVASVADAPEWRIIMNVTICVGSSCHLKGSPKVIKRLEYLIAQHHLEDQVELSGSFCMDQCSLGSSGVCVQVDNVIHSVTPSTVDSFFQEYILGGLAS